MLAARRRRASANSTFQRSTGQIASQAPGAPNRREWRRFDLRSALITTALVTGVLVGASLLPAGQALACVDVTDDPNSVSCDDSQTTTDNTLDVTAAGADSDDNDERHYLFSDHGPVDVDIAAGSLIDGFGLAVTTTQVGANIDMTHDGKIDLDGGVPTQAPGGALVLGTAGGDISYTGSGKIETDQNVNAFYLTTGGGGAVTIINSGLIRSVGGNGIVTENTSDVTITTSGPVHGNTGISATTSGDATVTITAANKVSGNAGAGIVTTAENGDTTITADTRTVTGSTFGANATSTGTGIITVTGAGRYAGGTGAGISAVMTGDGPAAGNDGIVISGDGRTISTAGTAIIADIQNIDNDSDILITRSGPIKGATGGIDADTDGGGDIVIRGIGPVISSAGVGVSATASGGDIDIGPGGVIKGATGGIDASSGGGDIDIKGVGPVATTTGTGISAVASGGDIVIVPGGAVKGETGISASTVGDGTVTVTVANRVRGTAGAGIVTTAVNGDTTITANAGRVMGSTFGANATSTGTGSITVRGAGNYRGGSGAGISAVMTGVGPGAGTDGIVISGTGRTTSTAGTAIIADIQQPANDSDIRITRSGATKGATGGIDADTDGGGDIVIRGVGPVTTTTGTGVSAVANGGDIVIFPGGLVRGETGISASTVGDGTVTVTVANRVTGTAGAGIVTSAVDGDTKIKAKASRVRGTTFGANATSTGTGSITVSGAGNYLGGTGAGISAVMTGLGPGAGNDGIVISAAGRTVSTDGTAIIADIQNIDNDSDILITRSGPIKGATGGIDARTVGGGDIDISGVGPVTTTTGTGVSAVASGGDIVIVPGGLVRGETGIAASTVGDGTVTVTVANKVKGTAGAGIVTTAVDGATTITANAGPVKGSTFGANATSTGTGSITVTGAGNYLGGTQAGISAVMTGGGPGAGLTGIVISGTGSTKSLIRTAIIADIQEPANDSDILITRSGVIKGATGGIDASTDGGGDIVISGVGPVTTTNGTGVSATASGGDVDITTGGLVRGGTGILASTVGDGTIDLTTGGTVVGTVGDGIDTAAVNGATTIVTNGQVTGADDGIVTSAFDGDTDIRTNAAVEGGEDGIDATAKGVGNIDVSVAGGTRVTGLTGAGVRTSTVTGEATIDNSGLIQGAFAAISGATSTVLEVVNQAGGLIRNLSADIGDLAISVTGTGKTEIKNDGTIRGRVELGSGDDTFTNSGRWATTGDSNFGDGNDSVINEGRLDVAELASGAEITHLANLESFTNASTGVIDMVDNNDPNKGDQLTIDGVYTGEPGSIIRMDLALVEGSDPVTDSDLLILDGGNPAQGTSDIVFNIVSTGKPPATTADTRRVVFDDGKLIDPLTVVENRGNLTTSNGDDDIALARSGLINYDLVSADNNFKVVSALDTELAGGLLLPIPATLAAVAFTTQRTPNPITATCIDPDNKPNAQAGWARGLAGEFNTETAGETSTGGVTSDLASENRTRFKTLQGGLDYVWCNLGNFASTLHLGVTVGQTWGDSIQEDPDRAAGIFGTDVAFDTFFVGPYAAMTRGNFAAQAALRFDHHEIELSNPTDGLDAEDIDVDADGISGSASMSYDFEFATFTVTPDVGVNVSKTEIDSFDIAGGTIVLDDLWSVMGHAGVTARTKPLGLADNLFVVPFASATLYHEFIEHADGKFDIHDTVIEAEANRVGTFGQLGVGANAVRLGNVVTGRPTVFGGARFDVQVGERIEGATATVFGRVQF